MILRALRWWHRWFGVLAGLWLFLVAASGSALVFWQEIDEALNPDLHRVEPGPSLPVERLARSAAEARPGFYASYIDLPDAPGRSAAAWMTRLPGVPGEDPGPVWTVYLDPATGQVLGIRDYEAFDLSPRGIANFLIIFHYSLHLGPWAHWLLGLMALLWTLDHVAAAVIATPRGRVWREAFRFRRNVQGHKRVFDLHRAGAMWLFPLTLVTAFTGFALTWYEPFRDVVDAVSPTERRPDETAAPLPAPELRPPLDYDDALALVDKKRVDSIVYNADKAMYWIRLFDPRDPDHLGRRWIVADARTGRILSDRHNTQGSAGNAVIAWQYPLHSGRAFGWPGRLLIFFTGIMTCVFVVTGYAIWWRKRRARIMGAERTGSRRTAGPALSPAE